MGTTHGEPRAALGAGNVARVVIGALLGELPIFDRGGCCIALSDTCSEHEVFSRDCFEGSLEAGGQTFKIAHRDVVAGRYERRWRTGIQVRGVRHAGGRATRRCPTQRDLGTPDVERTWTPDPDGLINAQQARPTFAPLTLNVGEDYAFALRTTSGVQTVQWRYWNLGTGNALLKTAQPFVLNLINASRTNQTGAFVETAAEHLPDIGFIVSGFHAGGSSGDGQVAPIGPGGVVFQ